MVKLLMEFSIAFPICDYKGKDASYIAPLEVCGHLICGTLYITSLAGQLHPTLV